MIKVFHDGKGKWQSYEATLENDHLFLAGYGETQEEAVLNLKLEVEKASHELYYVKVACPVYK